MVGRGCAKLMGARGYRGQKGQTESRAAGAAWSVVARPGRGGGGFKSFIFGCTGRRGVRVAPPRGPAAPRSQSRSVSPRPSARPALAALPLSQPRFKF